MLTTDTRHVPAEDQTIGRRRAVTPVSYPLPSLAVSPCAPSAGIPSITAATANADANAWAMTGRQETKVDFHDRWPLHPTP